MLGLPAYNEEDNIGKLIDKANLFIESIKDKGYDLDIVPLDDCSRDKTKEIIINKSEVYKNVKPLFHEVNKNLGGGMNTLLNYFLDNYKDGDVLIIMDSDMTHDPKYILDLLDKLSENHDVAIASRYRKGSEVKGVPGIRKFLTFGARIYYTLVLNIKGTRDYTCGYRAYKYSILDKAKNSYGNKIIVNDSFACMMELIYKLYRLGATIGEVPFVLRYDIKGGESSMKVANTVKTSLYTALMLRLKKF